jgi:4-amino-4-deoxy-L-arabinose transferase-like glycosyltransferase
MLIQRFVAHKLLVIACIALIFRVAVFLAFPGIFRFEQTGAIHGSQAYDLYATHLLDTGIFGIHPGQADALLPPMYSLVLTILYAIFGRSGMTVSGFNILLDMLTVFCLYHLGRRLFLRHGEWIGALAALMTAAYPYLIFQNLTLIDTPLFMTFMYAFLLLAVLLRERPHFDRGTLGLALLAGVVLGLGTLTRPILPPLAVLVAVWFLFRLNLWQSFLRLLPVALVSLALLGIWAIRNTSVYGTFVAMTTNSGGNFWQGNSQYVIPYFRAGYDVQWTSPDPGQITAADPYGPEADAQRFALAFQFLRENPNLIPELIWVKLGIHWSIDIAPRFNPTEGELPRLNYQGDIVAVAAPDGSLQLGELPPGDPVGAYSEPLFDVIGRWVQRLYWGSLFLIGLGGIIVTAREWRTVSLLWFVQIAMTAVYVAFHPSTRYRVPTDPAWFLFTAALFVWIRLWWLQRRRPVSQAEFVS